MSKIDYQALREAAEKATPGNWWIDSHGQAMVSFIDNEVLEVFVTDNKRDAVRHEDTGNLSRWRNDNDATFIATANPATVLALLDEIDKWQQESSAWQAVAEKQLALAADAEKRIAELEAEPVSQTCKLNEPSGNSPVTPDGWVIVPKKLTAENGAKGVLSGEFSETTFISCPECFGDDDCETCDGSGRIEIKVPVTWTTIKTIWAKGCEYFSIVAPQQDG